MAKGAVRVNWYPRDALDGMKFLTPMEELAYRRIIDMLYISGGELPDDDEIMAEQTRTFSEWSKVKSGLLKKAKIAISDGFITNEKCTEVLEDIQQKSDKARASGVASGKKRRTLLPTKNERPLNERSNSVDQKHEKRPTKCELSHIVNKSVIIDTDVSINNMIDDDPFDSFWMQYPRKVAKPKAKAAYVKALKKTSPEEILSGLMAWKMYWDDPQFIPHGATWLNDERWNDKPPERRNERGNAGQQGAGRSTDYIRIALGNLAEGHGNATGEYGP